MGGNVVCRRYRAGIGEPNSNAPHDEWDEDEVDQLVAFFVVVAAVEDELVHQVEVEAADELHCASFADTDGLDVAFRRIWFPT